MSETPNDPAGTTHQFQNFAAQRPAEKPKPVNVGLIVGAVVGVALLAVVVIAVVRML